MSASLASGDWDGATPRRWPSPPATSIWSLRAFATGTIAMHPGLADCGDVDNGLAITRSLRSGMPEAV